MECVLVAYSFGLAFSALRFYNGGGRGKAPGSSHPERGAWIEIGLYVKVLRGIMNGEGLAGKPVPVGFGRLCARDAGRLLYAFAGVLAPAMYLMHSSTFSGGMP